MTESAAARTYPLRTTAVEPHCELMRQCLDLSLQCEVSQTAFCVGSILVLPPPPLTSTPPTPISASKPLILSTGFSREPPRLNSHAESSAIVKFLGLPPSALTDLLSQQEEPWDGWEKWSHEDVLRRADCYTTLEPCSVRTSGQPDCARLLAENQVRRVFVGVQEPPDFVQCDGTRILEEASVEVWRVEGLEDECLAHARRGRE